MKLSLKLVKITLTILLFIIIPFVVFTLITSKTPIIKNISSFVVLTGSMQPTIPTGSVIYTQRQPSYKKGDVVAFKSGNVNVTHRIVKVLNTDGNISYQTKGDANNTPDSKTILASEILGKQMFFIPYVGHAIIFLQTPMGFFSTVFFPIVVFIILELWNLKKEIEKEAERKFRKKLAISI